MKQPYFSPEARQDLREILDYIADDNRSAARKLVDLLEESCRQLDVECPITLSMVMIQRTSGSSSMDLGTRYPRPPCMSARRRFHLIKCRRVWP